MNFSWSIPLGLAAQTSFNPIGRDIVKDVLDTCSHNVRIGPHRGSRDGMVTSGGSLLAAGRSDQPRRDARVVPGRLCAEGSCL